MHDTSIVTVPIAGTVTAASQPITSCVHGAPSWKLPPWSPIWIDSRATAVALALVMVTGIVTAASMPTLPKSSSPADVPSGNPPLGTHSIVKSASVPVAPTASISQRLMSKPTALPSLPLPV